MKYIIEVKVAQSELNEAIQAVLANDWSICGVKEAGEIKIRTLFFPISAQSANEPPLRRRI